MMQTFISYRRTNQDFAERLRDQLQTWGYLTWLDIENIPKGSYWAEEIDKGLETSSVIIGIISADALASRNVINEWYWAIDNQHRGKRLILLLYEKVTSLPHRLNSLNYIDFTQDEHQAFRELQNALSNPLPLYRDEIVTPEKVSFKYLNQEQQNRAILLTVLEESWIVGVLDPALREGGVFEITLQTVPDMVLKHTDYDDYIVPNNTHILQIFDDLNGELLILGEPGAGKTILLLQLAKELITQARTDENQPIPLVFNLSSWAVERKPLQDWLVEQLFIAYGVPRKVGKTLIEGEKLLLLLDGLDEVAVQVRNECVISINNFRKIYQTIDIVVCSRIADYDLLTEHLDLRCAIVLNPLNQTQIERYLAGDEYQGLRQIMQTDFVLQNFAGTPFLLNTMAYSYKGLTATNLKLPTTDSPTLTRKNDLFGRYVEKRLKNSSNLYHYPAANSRFWLAWLGINWMKQGRSIFFIEDLQPQLLPTQRQYKIFRLVSCLLAGLLAGIVWGSIGNLIGGSLWGLVAGLIGNIIWGLSGGLGDINPTEQTSISFSKRKIMLGFTIGIITSLLASLLIGLNVGMRNGLVIGIIVGLIIGLEVGIVDTLGNVNLRKHPNDGIWLSFYNIVILTILLGIILILAGGILLGLTKGLIIGIILCLAVSLVLGLGWALVAGVGRGGAEAIIKHFILRLMLTYNHFIPLNYARFLDYCTQAQLLRKVGGGYVFRHRELMEYFARLSPPQP